MQNKIFYGAALACAGSLMLASCSSPPPSQTTTINVEVPDSKAGATGDDKTASRPVVEIDETEEGQAAKKAASSEPTDRDDEDSAPAKQTASKPASSSQGKSDLMWYYDRAPAEYFVAFGGANRRSLLKRKGAIVDYKRNFIEIPGSASERDGDLDRLQLTLFPNGNEPWCAVSRIVWPRGQTPGKIGFYNNSADGPGLRQASAGFFPYTLKKVNGAYESALLPRRGLDVIINSAQESEPNGRIFRYSSKKWTGTPFTELTEAQYAEYEGG